MTYLLINALTLVFPLALSFDKKVAFYRKWKALIPAIGIMMLVFIPWDIYFTANGIWGFNPEHLCGISLFGLPIEEWLFFITVPYACMFIYACLKAYIKRPVPSKFAKYAWILIATVLAGGGSMFFGQAYTSTALLFATGVILLALVTNISDMHWFLLSFIVVCIPFLLINGWLTGSFTEQEIVWYNNEENLGIRVFTIPIEDFAYNLGMLLSVFIPYRLIRKVTSPGRAKGSSA